jgi:non-specific serine/threonine protein kinase
LIGSEDTASHNLPRQLTSFIGRERELAEVRRLLRASPLLTLTGPGGCGKTRLAVEAAEILPNEYPGGIWFVDLGPLADAALVPEAVAAVLGVRETGRRSLVESLSEYLRGRALLLLVDNCEHVVEACASLVETLLRSCPSLRVLSTSREALGITGEAVWRVPPLAVPDSRRDLSADRLAEFEAVRLFVDRARLVAPTFALTDQNAAAVAQICARLDGIPLAVELAAARVRVLTAEQIAARLDDRFHLLSGGARTGLPRQQTLRALIDWSYGLLSDRERILFRRLAAFAGSWTLEAAEGVCSEDGIDRDDVLDVLTGLVDKSLVLAEGQTREERYRFLETIRQYAAEKLVASAEATSARDRHRAWYATLAEQAEPELNGPDSLVWLNQLELAHDNLRAALDWSGETNPAHGVQLAGCLWRFWGQRGYLTEGRRRLRQALERAWAFPSPVPASATSGKDRAASASEYRTDQHLARALIGAGLLADFQGDFPEAKVLLEAGSAVYRRIDDRLGTAMALRALGGCLLRGGTASDQVKGILEESLELARRSGDRRRIAGAIVSLGHLAAREHDYAGARALIEEGLAIFRHVGDARGVGASLWALGWLALDGHDANRAEQCFQEGLTIAQRLGNNQGLGFAFLGFAAVARARGDLSRSRRLLEETVRLFQETGNSSVYGAIGFLGDVAILLGDTARGVRLIAAETQGPSQYGPLSALVSTMLNAGREASLARARATLGKTAFGEAWAAGQAMTLDETIQCVHAVESSGPIEAADRAPPPRAAPTSPLTAREREVAALVARGLTNRQIAGALVVTEGTAASHVEHIRTKLGFHSRAQIAAWAIANRLAPSLSP